MASVINTNISSITAQRNLTRSQVSLTTSVERLSSGLRINSAKDDAAGLSIATRMDAQVKGMNVAIRNANDGLSMAQTADGALSTAVDALQRMRELAVQSANGSNDTSDRANLDAEFQQLTQELNRLSTSTKFNGLAVIGTDAGSTTFQVGANVGDTLDITTTDLSSTVTTLSSAASDITTATNATAAITAIDDALTTINSDRATLGAAQNRFGYAISNLQVSVENQSGAKSRIMDTDFASETASMTRAKILQQAGTAMVAQANSLPNTVLTLLQQ